MSLITFCISHILKTFPYQVYGYSMGFGKANHQKTVEILKRRYPDYTIDWSDEGYWLHFAFLCTDSFLYQYLDVKVPIYTFSEVLVLPVPCRAVVLRRSCWGDNFFSLFEGIFVCMTSPVYFSWQRYEKIDFLGEGQFATVYKVNCFGIPNFTKWMTFPGLGQAQQGWEDCGCQEDQAGKQVLLC